VVERCQRTTRLRLLDSLMRNIEAENTENALPGLRQGVFRIFLSGG
jgi:hypothetical protein